MSSATRSGRQRGGESAVLQRHGKAVPVVATVALASPAVLARGAGMLAGGPSPDVSAATSGAVYETSGELGMPSGSAPKRKRIAVQKCLDAPARHTRSRSPSIFGGPHASPDPQLSALLLSSAELAGALCKPGLSFSASPSLDQQPNPTEPPVWGPTSHSARSLAQDGGSTNNSNSHLKRRRSSSNGAAGSESQIPSLTIIQDELACHQIDTPEVTCRSLGYSISVRGGLIRIFQTTTGLHVFCLLDVFQILWNDATKGCNAFRKFVREGGLAKGGPLMDQVRKAGHTKWSNVTFAPVEAVLHIVQMAWESLKINDRAHIIESKREFLEDMMAYIPKVKTENGPVGTATLEETMELGPDPVQTYTGAAPKLPPHGEVSADVSLYRLDPVPMSSLNDSPELKRQTMWTSMINVMELLHPYPRRGDIRHKLTHMEDSQVIDFMNTTHVILRFSYIYRLLPDLADILEVFLDEGL